MSRWVRRCLLAGALSPLVGVAPVSGQWYFLTHTADAGNTFGDSTFVLDPLIDGRPDAILIVTHSLNPGGVPPGITNPHEIGVAYSTSTGHWSIYNQDFAVIPPGASFNLWISFPLPEWRFVHTTDAGNTSPGAPATVLESAVLDSCPGAIPQVTHLRTPGGAPGPRHDHPLKLFYDTGLERWAILDQDLVTMPLGVSFNVWVSIGCPAGDATQARSYGFGTHVTTPVNTSGSTTRISHPAADGSPNAFLVVNAGGEPLPLNPHPIGVVYDPLLGQWGITNEGDESMSSGLVFHFLVVPVLLVDGFETGDASRWSSSVP